MILAAVLKACFLLGVISGALLPLVLWLERRQRRPLQERIGVSEVDIDEITLAGVLRPFTDSWLLLTERTLPASRSNPWLGKVTPIVVVSPLLVAIAIVPFGGVYAFGETRLSLVIADIDAGLALLFALAPATAFAAATTAWAHDEGERLITALRSGVRAISFGVPWALSLVGLVLVFGSIGLQEIALAQDTSFRMLGFAETAGWTDALPNWLAWIRLPGWGVFFQPLGLGLFVGCFLLGIDRRGSYGLDGSGASETAFGPDYLAEILSLVVVAATVVTLFLGGWSIPFVPSGSAIAAVAAWFGTGFATGVVLIAQVATFLAKEVLVLMALLALRRRLPLPSHERRMELCWTRFLPLAIANSLATAFVMLWLDGASR